MPNKSQLREITEKQIENSLFPISTIKRTIIIQKAEIIKDEPFNLENLGVHIPSEQSSSIEKLYSEGMNFHHSHFNNYGLL